MGSGLPPQQLPAKLQMQPIDFEKLAWEIVRTQGVDPLATQQKLAQTFRAIARTVDVAWLPKLHALFTYLDRLQREQKPPSAAEMKDLGYEGVQAEFNDMHKVLWGMAVALDKVTEGTTEEVMERRALTDRVRRQFQIL